MNMKADLIANGANIDLTTTVQGLGQQQASGVFEAENFDCRIRWVLSDGLIVSSQMTCEGKYSSRASEAAMELISRQTEMTAKFAAAPVSRRGGAPIEAVLMDGACAADHAAV